MGNVPEAEPDDFAAAALSVSDNLFSFAFGISEKLAGNPAQLADVAVRGGALRNARYLVRLT